MQRKVKVIVATKSTAVTNISVSVCFPRTDFLVAPVAVRCDGRDRGDVAAASAPQGVCGSNHCRGRRQSNEEHRKEQIVVRADDMWKGLFEFTHENARFEALHV